MTGDISVVIPARDAEAHLGAAIDSVLGQAGIAEIIVVDDGSTDRTRDVALACGDPRLRYIWQAGTGAAAARNHGAALARSELLAFLDADDLWLPGKIERQRAALLAGEGDLIFCLATEFVSPELTPAEVARLKVRAEPFNGIWMPALLMRRTDFQRVGPLDATLLMGEFMEWYGRAADLGLRSFTVDALLVRRRLHRTNQGRTRVHNRGHYALAAKQLLDRRRAAGN